MVNLTNYNKPGRLDDLFRTFLWQPVRMLDENADLTIKTDVTEDDKAYTVKADIPGVKKEDIAVEVNGNQLFISAEIKQEKEQKKGEKVVRSERYYGQVSRGFTFDREINANEAQATYEDGVLHLTLPKESGPPSKHLKIR